jgi:CheY-like chemotaxis protein
MSIRLDPAAEPIKIADALPGLCVLTVEDDEADAYLIGRALSDIPAVGRVVHARDGVEALAMVDRGEVTPDLAFIDLRMPLMDGFDLLVAFASRPGLSFPLVVLTSSSSPGDAIRSRLRSAVRVVAKPPTVTELYAVLITAIEVLCPGGVKPANDRPGKTPAYLLMGHQGAGIRRNTDADGNGLRQKPMFERPSDSGGY